ncbi:MAG TPA: FG-GAP-like repeat-containing protein, partial [Cyclobacteriaceae bacterium]|nr:FG-GAP-like repeat-containing protein [Cyclobacteriaceae bacterium]
MLLSAALALWPGCKKHGDDKAVEEKTTLTPEERSIVQEILSARTLGLAYLEENNLEKAEEEFLKLIRLAPDEALGYANLGIVYMRMGKFTVAEEYLKKGIDLDPNDPDIRLNLAKVYQLTDQEKLSREEMEKTLEIDPGHVQTLYSLAETYQNQSDKYSLQQWENYLKKIAEAVPANIVARLNLIETLARNGKSDEALKNLEVIGKLSPSFPDEALQYYDASIKNLRNSDTKQAVISIGIFHNFLKLTNNYQAGIRELKGSISASTVGNPIITFSESNTGYFTEGESILESIQFTDVSMAAGLVFYSDSMSRFHPDSVPLTHVATGDMDRDGDQDLYFGTYDPRKSGYTNFLLRNDVGRFKEINREAGIRQRGPEASAEFVDYDNDGFLDLYIVSEGPNTLYFNVSEGKFEDITAKSGAEDRNKGRKAIFFDMDHEGDLDFLLANASSAKIYRNNSDGTFSDVTAETNITGNAGILDAEIGDFDDDGDIDLFVIQAPGMPRLYSNVRQGRFMDVTEKSGLNPAIDISPENLNDAFCQAAASADYNNDGFQDIFLTTDGKTPYLLFKNDGNGVFIIDKASDEAFRALENTRGYDAVFLDFDNDGFQDILAAGISHTPGKKAVFLMHNTADGRFENVSHLLPANLVSGRQLTIADYNEDGDMDIFITGIYGGLRLLRNDGGNINHHLKVQIVGLRTGSSKNNYFGIGSKVEVRAGDLYQMKTITAPSVHFGMGAREKADVVRILWTNGVSQNIFAPGSDQDLVEQQELKGSCPFLYTWNGREFVFQKDMMWRSALGMPMGIMGGNMAYAFPNASDECLKIPGDQLAASNGQYKIRVTSELWETIYFDKAELIVLDHPDTIDVFVDEKFISPPFPELQIFQVSGEKIPAAVTNENGIDLTDLASKKDDRYISEFSPGKYQGIGQMHDLIIDPGNIRGNNCLYLIMNGWIFPTDASINYAVSQTGKSLSIPPYLQVMDRDGN